MENHLDCNDELLISVSNGDEQAFGDLFFQYKDIVYSIALSITANACDAEEVVQDVFSRLWANKASLPKINAFKYWIKTVARNRALTVLKKRSVEMKRMGSLLNYFPLELPNAEQEIQKKELQSLISDAMDKLSPQQRRIFELSKLSGMDRNAVAKRLGLSSTTVSNHLSIALKAVRTYLFEHRYMLFLFMAAPFFF